MCYYFLEFSKKVGKHFETSSQIIKTKNIDLAKDYIAKKYGPGVKIEKNRKKIKDEGFSIEKFIAEPDFKESSTVGEILKTEPRHSSHVYISARIEQNEYVTKKETIDRNGKKVIELMQKELKLKPKDKIVFIQRIPEGYGVGELHAESGRAITSTGKDVYYWLEFNEEKGHYLDPLDVKKIETLE